MCVEPSQNSPSQEEHGQVIGELRTLAEGSMEGRRAEADQAQGDGEEVEVSQGLWTAGTCAEGNGREAECIVDWGG